LNVDALSQNPVGFPEEDEDFGSDVTEQEEQLGITPAPARSNATNEVSINLFTLQHIGQAVQHIGQAVDDVEEHHTISECGGQSIDSPSKEGMPQMDQMEYKKMVVEAQIMVDEAKNR
jgi:hypothetical protein